MRSLATRPKPRRSVLHDLGDRVREERVRAGLSQEAFGEQLGVHRTYLAAIERGERNLTLLRLVRLADALGLDPGDLVTGLRLRPGDR